MREMESISVEIYPGDFVIVQGTTRYTGTLTGPGTGGKNIETYEVTIQGITVPGTWNGDGRRNTVVVGGDVTAELREKLLPTYRAQQARREKEDQRWAAEAEKKFYGRRLR